MKITVPIAASAGIVALGLVLTGCTSGGLPGSTSSGSTQSGSGGSGGSSGSGGSGSNSGPTRSYSDDDLVAILKKAQAARNLGGTVKTNAEIKSAAGDVTPDLTKSLTAAGGKFVPASCGTYFDQLIQASESILGKTDWKGASLQASNDILSVASTSSQSATAGVIAKTQSIMSELTDKCASMTIAVGSASIAFTITKASATTKGSQTFAYEEDVTVPGESKVKTFTIEAVYGNLYIGDVSLSNPNQTDMEANINAVIDAANG